MRVVQNIALAAAFVAGLVSASPMTRQASLSPCGNITEQYNEAVAANTTSSLVVDPQLAYECLNSMPFNSTLATAFLTEFRKYLVFQSTIPVLKDPPNTYLSPAVDLLGTFDEIFQKANSSQYESQYQMDTDLTNLINSANDGHLSVYLCSNTVFSFNQGVTLVSVSTDGLELPKVYSYLDAIAMSNGATDVSDVVQINGQNATEYLEKLGLTQSNQDPDAQWNDLFASFAKEAAGIPVDGSFFSNNGLWPGSSELMLTYSNGTTYTAPNRAVISTSEFNFTDGEALFEYACIPKPSTTSSGNSTNSNAVTPSLQPTATGPPRRYPTPLVADPYNLVLGYYLDDDFNDTAVLFIPNFETSSNTLPNTTESIFAEVANDFVRGAVADGKTKMIIDVSGNPGGTISSGFNLFKLFFPDLEAYSATRMRDHEAEQYIMQAFSILNLSEADALGALEFLYTQNPFEYASVVTPGQNGTFDSWEALYGPDNINGANMTALYANFNFTAYSTDLTPIQGYGAVPDNFTGRPFPAENILIVSDGFCQSTCTTFTNLMTNFGGVKSLAFGGRPIDAPMQIIGGVRGAQSAEWDLLSAYADAAYQIATNDSSSANPIFTPDELAMFEQVKPIPTSDFPLLIQGTNLNLRNSYNPDDDEIPLQFKYQAADCRLFYTFENVYVPASQWTAAASAVWGGGQCVANSASTNSTHY